jgi:hypothetical protein
MGEPVAGDWQVLVTDLDCLMDARWESHVLLLKSNVISVEQVCNLIMEKTTQKQERQLLCPEGQPIFFAFYGKYGSSGVTSMAITAGRFLAGAYGEKVLYLSFTPYDDSRLYSLYSSPFSEDAFYGARQVTGKKEAICKGDSFPTRKELLYRLRQGIPFFFQRYVEEDDYGLAFLYQTNGHNCFSDCEEEEIRRILESLSVQTDYDVVLVDLGTGAEGHGLTDLWAARVEVGNAKDLRWSAVPEEGKIIATNYSDENSNDSGRLKIAMDSESFQRVEVEIEKERKKEVDKDTSHRIAINIAINMTKKYANGVKNLAELLENVVLKAKKTRQ